MTNGGRSKAARLATLTSQIVNVLRFDGNEDETVSGRAYREGVFGGCPTWARRAAIIDWLFWFDPDHCRKSHEVDLRNAAPLCAILKQTPPAFTAMTQRADHTDQLGGRYGY